jgi:hypothetical protein
MNPLTIAYVTNRKNPRIQWFFDSLKRQLAELGNQCLEPQVVVVSFHPDLQLGELPVPAHRFKFMQPMPNPYMGAHRVTKSDCFAAAVSRNTALCAADAPYIAFVDDLSVLMPGWLDSVRVSIAQGKITFGAYKKVKNLVVKDGLVVSHLDTNDWKQGLDNRLIHTNGHPIQCSGEWLYGCSLVIPTDVLCSVGGFCSELSGTLGFEDCLTGIALQNIGHSFYYDPKMLTLESEEAHFEEKPFFKTDKGVSPQDKSHAALRTVRNGMKYFENAMPAGGIRKVREDFLAGKGWPWPAIGVQPLNDWYDGQSLKEVG